MIDYAEYMSFNGSNQYASIPRSVGDDFTIEFWFSSTQGISTATTWWSGAGLVDMEVGGYTNDFGTSLNSDGKVLAGCHGDCIASSAGFNDGKWHHVAFTREKSTGYIKLYVDGRLEASKTSSDTSTLNAASVIHIAKIQAGGNYFAGKIAEIRLWDKVRSSTEINNDMNTALNGTETNLVALYQSDSGSSTLNDETANGNNGTLYNSPVWNTLSDIILVTQLPVEVVVKPSTQKARLTQIAVEAVVKPSTQKARVTQLAVEVVVKEGTVPSQPTTKKRRFAQLI